ncbi:NADH-quinone oxidoreductase subunit J family protein [Salinigranum halophilum]|jgi:NADH-quinone oxidoreductase subunit J|uniref:NADH-quinone oxidoreductase subunit J family protein n=1 Tax=Salinigranum halophilum TaxID=2565931 RepID=UPI0010A934D3|nr:proton-conducting membrane transporter [Salinigranum halophilum]
MKPTTRPELDLGSHLVPGLAAVALFAVMAGAFLTAQFPEPQGFPADANVTASIGYAMFNLDFGSVPAESFLVAFLIIAIALDAALDGAIILARREDDGKTVSLLTDGGRELKRTVFGDDTESESDIDADEDAGASGGDR